MQCHKTFYTLQQCLPDKHIFLISYQFLNKIYLILKLLKYQIMPRSVHSTQLYYCTLLFVF